MVDVFISYSRADVDAVRGLANKIEAEGYSVWWDAELPPHKSYGEVIQEKVAACKAAVVVWSPTAAQSEWVRAEADMARNHKKLIQTALGDIMPPLPFNQIQFANIGDWRGEDDHSGWRKIKMSLADLCGEGELKSGGMAIRPSPPPAAATMPIQAFAAPPPGSLEAHRSAAGSSPKWPIFAGVGVGALGLMGSAALLLSSASEDEPEDIAPVALLDQAEPGTQPASKDAPATAPAPAATQAAPDIAQIASGPSFPAGPQTFNGALNAGQSRSYTVGLNANTSYMIVGQCDTDCSDIDMWLYDENGNMIDSDTLDDDVPVLEVTPIRSAQFSVRIEMFVCTVQPCGIQIEVTPQ